MNAFSAGGSDKAALEAICRTNVESQDYGWATNAQSAELTALDGKKATIILRGVVHETRIALSCLIQPEPGDRVLTSQADGMIWVLSVLERVSDKPVRLWTQGNLQIVSDLGTVSIIADKIELVASDRVQVLAGTIELHAGVGRFILDELMQVGRSIGLHVAKLRTVAGVVETFADHLLSRAKHSSRFVEDGDLKRAGSVDHRMEGTWQINARTAFLNADTVVRVDAEQIHMG